MARTYELKLRAQRQVETRQRIIDAAIALHQELGPTATSVTDIAERARVGRVTVYRHFPDELSLARACSGHYLSQHPLPDLEPWRALPNPAERLRAALRETYAYHRATETMMARVLADPGPVDVMEGYRAHWQLARDVLADGWPVEGRSRALLRAGIGHALQFATWQSLVREHGLTDDEAVEVAARLVG